MRIFVASLLYLVSYLGYTQSFNDLFEKCDVSGSVTLYDSKTNQWFFTDSIDSSKPSLPASTFKIVNTLVALQEGIISSTDDTIRFSNREVDTTRYGYRPGTYNDVKVSEAFKKSIVWVYRDFSQQINHSTYLKYLNEINYSNRRVESELIDFWNYGSFGVTPIEQIEMLKSLYNLELPFEKDVQIAVKEIMCNGLYDGYKVYGKTGWTRSEDSHIGWWVGFIDFDQGPIFFATRIRSHWKKIIKDLVNAARVSHGRS